MATSAPKVAEPQGEAQDAQLLMVRVLEADDEALSVMAAYSGDNPALKVEYAQNSAVAAYSEVRGRKSLAEYFQNNIIPNAWVKAHATLYRLQDADWVRKGLEVEAKSARCTVVEALIALISMASVLAVPVGQNRWVHLIAILGAVLIFFVLRLMTTHWLVERYGAHMVAIFAKHRRSEMRWVKHGSHYKRDKPLEDIVERTHRRMVEEAQSSKKFAWSRVENKEAEVAFFVERAARVQRALEELDASWPQRILEAARGAQKRTQWSNRVSKGSVLMSILVALVVFKTGHYVAGAAVIAVLVFGAAFFYVAMHSRINQEIDACVAPRSGATMRESVAAGISVISDRDGV